MHESSLNTEISNNKKRQFIKKNKTKTIINEKTNEIKKSQMKEKNHYNNNNNIIIDKIIHLFITNRNYKIMYYYR